MAPIVAQFGATTAAGFPAQMPMADNFDLHLHSSVSDGRLPPGAVVRHARASGVTHLALTDHDTTAGVAEAMTEAVAVGITCIPGIEISATWAGTEVHVVGLGIDIHNSRLQTRLAGQVALRERRAREIGQRLENGRIHDALAGARAMAAEGVVTRTHFARWLVAAGHAPDAARAYKRFLGRGKPGYVPPQWPALEEVVEWIVAAGGVAVLAHPLRYPLSSRRLEGLVAAFAAANGQAIEVVAGRQTPDRTARAAALALKYALQASRGSDFHDPEQAWLVPGQIAPLPGGLSPVWGRLG